MSRLRASSLSSSGRTHPVRSPRGAVLILCSIALLFLSGCATGVGYLWKQGGYLLRYRLGSKSIASLVREQGTPLPLRAFLKKVESIKRYAVDEIGLAGNRNYTIYKRIDRDYLVNVVQAADPLSFTRYEWRYPLFGKLPYKGYYDPADAKAEAERLRSKGYDVIVRQADAFSTLGIFRDPVYSYMQKYTDYELASLIIHEETHATLFLKGQDQFNEGLATFVGDQGALDYLRSTAGELSVSYRDAVAEQADARLLLLFIEGLRSSLEGVYAKPIPRSDKLIEKAEVISHYQSIFTTVYHPQFRTKRYRALSHLPLNNAYIMLFGLYTRDISLLERYDREICRGNLKIFMAEMKRLSRERGRMIPKIRAELAVDVATR